MLKIKCPFISLRGVTSYCAPLKADRRALSHNGRLSSPCCQYLNMNIIKKCDNILNMIKADAFRLKGSIAYV